MSFKKSLKADYSNSVMSDQKSRNEISSNEYGDEKNSIAFTLRASCQDSKVVPSAL